MKAADLAQRLPEARRSGDGYVAQCPAHDDRRASLSFRDAEGRVLLHCHTGCAPAEIVATLGLSMADLFHDAPTSSNSKLAKRREVAAYDYRDERGDLLFQVVRYEPKDFRQRRPDPERPGKWVNNLKGVRRVLYRLPELQGQRTVYVAEGEKDADRFWSLGIPATTNPAGAGKWRMEYAEQLRAAGCERAVILPDNDAAGETHAGQVAASLLSTGIKVKIVRLPGLPEKGDVSDWLDAGHTREELAEAAKTAPEISTADLPAPKAESEAPEEMPGQGISTAQVEPAAEPVDGADLLDELIRQAKRFIIMGREGYVALALWILFAWTLRAFSISPRLALMSAEKRSGKTTGFKFILRLIPSPLPASNISPAVLFRAIEEYAPTLLVDEVDSLWRRKGDPAAEEIRGLLNAGHERELAFVLRNVQEGKHWFPRRFNVFAAIALAGIGNLPDTL